MRYASGSIILLTASIFAPSALPSTLTFQAPAERIVGKNLLEFGGIRLAAPAPDEGTVVTVTSDDPTKLLLSLSPDEAGAKSITLKVNRQYIETPDFCLQGLADTGVATYTVSAPGFAAVKGSVTLTPSAILMAGPSRQPSFSTTPAMTSKLSFFSARVDSSGSVTQQPVAGKALTVELTSSDAKVGAPTTPSVVFQPGESSTVTTFKPAGVGTTTLAMKIPPGFSAPPKMATVVATIELPGIGVIGEVFLGKDLQITGNVLLGQAAPANGVDVTLTSEDPKKMILSTKADQVGAESITIHVPAGKTDGHYFIQGLGDAGTVNYTASAPGYRNRVAPVYMSPSGIMVAYAPYGAPDRAEVQRDTRDARPFSTSLASKKPVHLTLWVVYLDKNTHRGADITVQRLRAGVTATVELTSSNPEVGTVTSPVTISSQTEKKDIEFTPLSEGKTTISVSTPAGFTRPTNAVNVVATVNK